MKAHPDFIEVKAYMWVGESRERLKKENMPLHEEIVAFTKDLMKHLPEYDIVTDHVPSRVVMCAKKKFYKNAKWYTWIDFPKFIDLSLSGKEFTTDDYLKVTPAPGLSGKGTLDRRKEWEEKLKKKEEAKAVSTVDEKTDEMSFW